MRAPPQERRRSRCRPARAALQQPPLRAAAAVRRARIYATLSVVRYGFGRPRYRIERLRGAAPDGTHPFLLAIVPRLECPGLQAAEQSQVETDVFRGLNAQGFSLTSPLVEV